jgi:hypothetical protein
MTFWAHRLMSFFFKKRTFKNNNNKRKNHDKLFVDQSWLFWLMPQQISKQS